MDLKLEKINDIKIKIPKINKYDADNVKGKEVFSNPYNNIYINAYKNSGKTTVIFNILQYINKATKIYFFVPTFTKDSTYIKIQELLDKKGIEYEVFDTIENNLKSILEKLLLHKGTSVQGAKNNDEMQIINYQPPNEHENIIKVKIPKLIAAQHLFIFDDISNELHNTDLTAFLKKNRHIKARIIISSQYILDLSPQSRSQIDNFLLFGGIDEKRLLILYNNMDTGVSFEDFLNMYKNATGEKYNFLYYDKMKNEYRKNFDLKFYLKKN